MTDVRIFGSANKVVESFKTRGVPPQRSIGRIHAMGLESGLCLPLFSHDLNIGFLFMNAVTNDLFSIDKFAASESLWSDCAALQLKLVAADSWFMLPTPFEHVKTELGIYYST
jgi:hypothetical protein